MTVESGASRTRAYSVTSSSSQWSRVQGNESGQNHVSRWVIDDYEVDKNYILELGATPEGYCRNSSRLWLPGTPRRTLLADHCQRQLDDDVQDCVFICTRKKGLYIAKDIAMDSESPSLDLSTLRNANGGWLKRYSLYSAVGVERVMMLVLDVSYQTSKRSQANPVIEVAIEPFNYDEDAKRLDEAIVMESMISSDPTACDVDPESGEHDLDHCHNTIPYFDDEAYGGYCRVQEYRRLKAQRENLRWVPHILKCYWQRGLGKKEIGLLRDSGLIHHYEELALGRSLLSHHKYDPPIQGFIVVEGWHVRYLVCLVGSSLLGSVCIIAVTMALTQSVEAALTAGSYACALAAALIAVFTLLSALI